MSISSSTNLSDLCHQQCEIHKSGSVVWVAGPASPHHSEEFLRAVCGALQTISLSLHTEQDLNTGKERASVLCMFIHGECLNARQFSRHSREELHSQHYDSYDHQYDTVILKVLK